MLQTPQSVIIIVIIIHIHYTCNPHVIENCSKPSYNTILSCQNIVLNCQSVHHSQRKIKNIHQYPSNDGKYIHQHREDAASASKSLA